MSEEQLQYAVLELAGMLKWRTAHFRPAKTDKGWRTAVAGDGKGFPDLVMVRGGHLIFAELKSEKGRTTPEQDIWLEELRDVAVSDDPWEKLVHIYVWRPADWINGTIERVLRSPHNA